MSPPRASYLIFVHADGLAVNGNAPSIFTRINRWGLPWTSMIVNSLFGLLAYMAVSNGAGKVFNWSVHPSPLPHLSAHPR